MSGANSCDKKNLSVTVCTILAETSPQALPLGAACICSAIKSEFSAEDPAHFRLATRLEVFSAENTPSPESIADKLLQNKPDAICFSLFVWNHVPLSQAASIIRSKSPGTVLIAGGPEVTAKPEAITEYDFLVTGEGESAVPQLLRRLFSAQEKNPVALPQVIHGKRIPPEKLCSPYLDGTLKPSDFGNGALWELARGCPFKCSYCYESKGEKTVSYFPMERIEKELELFAKNGVRQVFVLDPTYNAQKARALEILSLIQRKAPGIFFHFECRAEFLDAELAQAFSRISCSLQIGLQSADKNVLQLVNRSFNPKEFARKIALLNKHGIVFGFDLIYGLPGDTLQGFLNSIDFSIGLYPNSLELFRLSVLPGTNLYDRKDELLISSQKEPPYLVQSTPGFSAQDLAQAEYIANATALFYSAGRAVPWFCAVVQPLKCKPSVFFLSFAHFLKEKNIAPKSQCLPHAKAESLQIDFVSAEYKRRKLERLLPAALDLIRLNGAFSRAYADGLTSRLNLSYHPDDLFSQYSQNLDFFCQNAKKIHLSILVKPSGKGPVWRKA